MNPIVLNKLPLEYKMLWEASKMKKLENSSLRDDLRNRVRRARNAYRDELAQDELDRKLTNYGNGGGWALDKITQLAHEIFDNKKPSTENLGQWISVELEVVMPNQGAETNFISFVRKNGYKSQVTIKDDGSIKLRKCECEEQFNEDDELEVIHERGCQIDGKEAYGREIVLTFKFGDWEFVKQICSMLNKIKCSVNKTCGMHVHFDMRHLESKQKMSILAHRVARVVPALKQILPASRQNNRFCDKVINNHRDNGNGDARYAFVNVKSWDRHRTLEVRGHSGTTDATKIINWVRIIHTVMAKPNRKSMLTVQDMMQKFKFDADLIEYMVVRQKKFSNVLRQPVDDVANDDEVFSIASIGDQLDLGSYNAHPALTQLPTVQEMHETFDRLRGIQAIETTVTIEADGTITVSHGSNHAPIEDEQAS